MKKATVTKTKKAEKVKDTKTHPLIKGLRMTEKSALGADNADPAACSGFFFWWALHERMSAGKSGQAE